MLGIGLEAYMKKILIIPDRNNLSASLELACEYSLGFEYNDFFNPHVLDNEEEIDRLLSVYSNETLPSYCTMHGAFFDVIPFSVDSKIRQISHLRIEQSIELAKKIGASAVVFHTNYNPYLNSTSYVEAWIKENVAYWSGVLESHPEINIYLENMFDQTPDILKRLAEELCRYENFGVCFDYAHAAISKTAPKDWAKELSKYVKHIHLNDNDLVSDLHLPWSDGKINRQGFYDIYEKYLNGASILLETSSIEGQRKSLECLVKEKFL